MALTLLLDLDNTLLGNDMDTFLPAYLTLLADHLAPFAENSDLSTAFMVATREMLSNNDPERTLQEVFASAFFPFLQVESGSMAMAIETFYQEEFPTLEPLTQPRPEAVALVEEALAREYKVAITTSPGFPLAATLERLKWAGLSAREYPFELISSNETFHFAKPNSAFLSEVLAQLGWPDGPIVVVGDDLQMDIVPARCLELATFWVDGSDGQAFPEGTYPHARGGLAQVISWIDSLSAEELTPEFHTPPALSAILRATVAAIHTLLAGLPPDSLSQRHSKDEWSLTEILCHLRDVEREVHLPRLRRVLQEDNPFLPVVDTDAWAEERRYCEQNGLDAFLEFSEVRIETLVLVDNLDPEQWLRPARHTVFGPTQLQELVRIQSGHDRLHTRQFKKGLDRSRR